MSLLRAEVIHSADSGKSYRIVKVLGHGAFGEVLLAEDATQQQYAIKQLYMRDREQGLPLPVAREVSALQQLQHPNIVSLLDVAISGPCIYLVQELCKTDLAAVLNATDHLLPCSIVKGIMQQLLQALAACHAHGFMHRDVKPSNVLVTGGGIIKLADFGLARVHIPDKQQERSQEQCCQQQRQGQQQQAQLCHAAADLAETLHSQLHLDPGQHLTQQQQDHQDEEQQQQQHDVLEPPSQMPSIGCCLPGREAATAAAHPCDQPPNGCFTAAQGTRWYRAPELLYGSRSYGPQVDMWAAGMVFAEVLGLAPLLPGQSDIDQLARMQQTLGSISLQEWPEAQQLPDWHKISFGANPGQPLSQLLPDAPAAALELLQAMVRYKPSQRVTAAAALEHMYFRAEPAPAAHEEVAAVVQELLQQQQPTLFLPCVHGSISVWE